MSTSSSSRKISNTLAASGLLSHPMLRRKLTPKEIQDFKLTTLDELRGVIQDIQKRGVQNGHLQCLTRMKPFISAMQDYGKIVEVFLNTSDILCFVWVRGNPHLIHERLLTNLQGTYKISFTGKNPTPS